MKHETSLIIVFGLLVLSTIGMVTTASWMSPTEIIGGKLVIINVKYSDNAAILTIKNNDHETIYMRQEALVQWNLTQERQGTIQKNATLEPIESPEGSIPANGLANFTVTMQDGSKFVKGETYRFVISTTEWTIETYSIRYDSKTS